MSKLLSCRLRLRPRPANLFNDMRSKGAGIINLMVESDASVIYPTSCTDGPSRGRSQRRNLYKYYSTRRSI